MTLKPSSLKKFSALVLAGMATLAVFPLHFLASTPPLLAQQRTPSSRLVRTIGDRAFPIFAVAFSPTTSVVVSGSNEDTIKFWNADTGELNYTASVHLGDVRALDISPNGQILASGSDDNTANLWNMETGQLISTLFGHTKAVRTVAFSPDGRTLATGSWDNT
ncbi:MAG: WD40 repeat domain-containing protein, partial [Chroococcales cyanobacterium]